MTLNVVPFEQAFAEFFTGLAISGGQNGNAANIVKRANTALAVAQVGVTLASGDALSAATALQALLANSTFDPGVALGLNSLLAAGVQLLQVQVNLGKAIPFLGATAEVIAQNVVAGINAAANAEISKYGAAAPAA